MTLLRILLEPTPGPPVATEILAAATGETRHAVLTPGQPYTAELPSGIYAVRIAPPGADRVTTTVVIPEDGPPEDTLTFTLPAGRLVVGERHTVGPLDPLGLQRRHRLDAATPPETLDEARRLPSPGVFVRSPFRLLLEPVTVEHTLEVHHAPGAEHDEAVHLYVVEPHARGGRFRMIALPAGTTARILPAAHPGELPLVNVHPTDPDARALLDYQRAGRLDSAATVTDHVADSVGARIARGGGDSVAGCAVAHQLFRRPDQERAHAWTRMLADEFPGAVDTSVLLAWTLLSEPAAMADPAEARDRLITAADPDAQGLPVLLPGLQLLRTGLRRLIRTDAARGQWDPRVETALRTVDTYLMAADRSSPFVSLTLTDAFWHDLADATVQEPVVRGTVTGALNALLSGMGIVTPRQNIEAQQLHPWLAARWDGPVRRLTLSAGDDRADSWAGALWQKELRVAFRDQDHFAVSRISRSGTADLFVPDEAAGRLYLLSACETADEPAILLQAPTVAYAASTDERAQRVAFDSYELVLERTRQRAWHITARSHATGGRPGWALLGVRVSGDAPYQTYALPLVAGDDPGAEASLVLDPSLFDSGWYAVPDPVPKLPSSGRRAILDRSMAAAADRWTRETVQAAAAASDEER
ncbi:hypothetical protein ACIP4Q_20710 [Streptomyces massasporeus]